MNKRTPPRLAVALLNRFGPDDEALSGDLVEEFEDGRSRFWFWTQALTATFAETVRSDRDIRPLRLVEDDSPLGVIGQRSSAAPSRRRTVNLTASPIAGIGGLGLFTLGLLMTWIVPQVWWIAGGSILAGIAAGLCLVASNRRRAALPRGGPPTLLMRDTFERRSRTPSSSDPRM